MERQLKERLIGAAVLIAVAVIMVPEMFSGSGSRDSDTQKQTAASNAASSESGQIKTYRIDLQHRDTAPASSESAAQIPPVVPDTRMASASSASSVVATATASVSSTPAISSSSSRASIAASSAISLVRSTSSSSSSHAATTVAGWSVQLGSFAAEGTARQIVTSTKSHGFAAYLSSVSVGGKTLYRVRVGPFADRDAAEAALGKLKHNYAQASLVAPNH